MNIGIVTTWFERGAAYVSRQYMQVLGNHHVYIYSRGGEREGRGNPEWDQFYVTWGKPPLVDEPQAVDLEDFDRWLTERKIDLVFFNEQRCWEPVIRCHERGIINGAYVVHYREDTIPLFDCHDFLICNARHHARVFQNHDCCRFIPWGTDIELFRKLHPEPVSAGRVTFFHSGGMNPKRKGTDLVLEAFGGVEGPAHLVLHVQESLKPMLPKALSLIDALGDRVTLVEGTVRHASQLYRRGDVCVYPTRHEGLGLTIAESLASGLPIIVTDQEPVSEHADGETVRTVPVERRFARSDGDYWPQTEVYVPALRQAIQRFVDERDLLPGLAFQARARAERIVDWRKNAAGVSDTFRTFTFSNSIKKQTAIEAAKRFTYQQRKHGLRNWVGGNMPWLVRAVRLVG